MHARVSALESGSDMDARLEISMSRPAVGEAGATGQWRNKRPIMDPALCLAAKAGKVTCQICWVYCPDGCIAQGAGPVIDLTYCKGCGICAQECPADAIAMVPEAPHGVCAIDENAEVR
jgi:pyruvate ferredoxin oxidoreductase delta subunit